MLDTHSFLWFILDDPRLVASAKQVIEDPANDVESSPAASSKSGIDTKQG